MKRGEADRKEAESSIIWQRDLIAGIEVSNGDALRLLAVIRVFGRVRVENDARREMHVLLRTTRITRRKISPAYLAQRFKKWSTT